MVRFADIIRERHNQIRKGEVDIRHEKRDNVDSVPGYLFSATKDSNEVKYYMNRTGWSERTVKDYLVTRAQDPDSNRSQGKGTHRRHDW